MRNCNSIAALSWLKNLLSKIGLSRVPAITIDSEGNKAGVAQLIERVPSKYEVAGLNPVTRSTTFHPETNKSSPRKKCW